MAPKTKPEERIDIINDFIAAAKLRIGDQCENLLFAIRNFLSENAKFDENDDSISSMLVIDTGQAAAKEKEAQELNDYIGEKIPAIELIHPKPASGF